MKRIINGRLWDDDFMFDVASRTFDVKDPVTGEVKTYRECLKRGSPFPLSARRGTERFLH